MAQTLLMTSRRTRKLTWHYKQILLAKTAAHLVQNFAKTKIFRTPGSHKQFIPEHELNLEKADEEAVPTAAEKPLKNLCGKLFIVQAAAS